MAFNNTIDENIKALGVQSLPDGIANWYQDLDALKPGDRTTDSKVAKLAAWALALLPNEWQVAAINLGLTEDDLHELAAWADDMIDTRRGIDGPSE